MFEKLGKFHIKKVLGQGAMGEVYLGEDPSIGRQVAIKTILPSAAQGDEAKERFEREAKAAGALNHPNLVTIYEFGEDQNVMYIAMELVPGHDLQELLADQSLTQTEVLEVLGQVCDGLDYAHRQGVVHRDIKPSNIRVQRDGKKLRAKVMDFGVARVANSDMTATGMVMGTVSYMAPEYISTGIPDPRADIFACGVILYEALAGERPFPGDTTATVLYRIVHEAPKPLDPSRLQGISPAVQGILDQALEKDPSQRYQRAEVMSAALRSAKDPHWVGGVALSTTASARQSSREAQMAPTVATQASGSARPMPAAKVSPVAKSSSNAGAWVAGLIVIAGLAVGGAWYWNHALKQAPAPPMTAQSSTVESTGTSVSSSIKAPPPVAEEPKTSKAQPQEKPMPAPSPVITEPPPEPPAPERQEPLRESPGKLTLNELPGDIESHPFRAHQHFQAMQRQDPQNAKAYALDMVALYQLNQYGEMAALIQKARANGVNPRAFNVYPRFRMMMKEETRAHRIPQGLRERMRAGGHDFNSGD